MQIQLHADIRVFSRTMPHVAVICRAGYLPAGSVIDVADPQIYTHAMDYDHRRQEFVEFTLVKMGEPSNPNYSPATITAGYIISRELLAYLVEFTAMNTILTPLDAPPFAPC